MATPAQRTEAARKFAIDVARLAANTRCHNVVVLDVRGISPVTDYFVLATGHDYDPLAQCGTDGESWMLIDFVDVVLHVFNQESRMFYDLDGLWGDAKKVEWKEAATAATA